MRRARTHRCQHCSEPIVPRMGVGRSTYWVHTPKPRSTSYYRNCTATTVAEPATVNR
ncbi:hypothetical protein [Gordonia sp. (in: high G+C Gram-positive bacteria)]|uniref:hypothetical protein n=1 Tax=Gordonia sp. (in: high G+C Gram-positive bacteria) TaxID=84139 RepID=UPI00334082AA